MNTCKLNKNYNQEFTKNWESFRDWTSKNSTDDAKSSMWQRMIKDFDSEEKSLNDIKNFLFRSNTFRGYGFVLEKIGYREFGLCFLCLALFIF